MTDLAARLALALERHGVAPKQAAHLADIHPATLYRWLSGETRLMDATALLRLCDALGIRDEVFSSRRIWFDHKGGMRDVPDFARSARELQGLSANVPGDHASSLRRNLGWISLEVSGQVAKVRYHERGLAPAAVRRLVDWVSGRATAVERAVELEEQDGLRRLAEMPAELAAEACFALELACRLVPVRPACQWRVRRLPLGDISHSVPRRLASLASSRQDLLSAASTVGLLRECSIFRLEGTRVVTMQVGDSSPLPWSVKNELTGRNVMARPDVRYAEVIRSHIMDAARDGDSYHFLDGPIDGKRCRWRRPIFACGNGLFLTHTEKVAS